MLLKQIIKQVQQVGMLNNIMCNVIAKEGKYPVVCYIKSASAS